MINKNKSSIAIAVLTTLSTTVSAATVQNKDIDERMVITATQTNHTELTAPASVSVITEEDIKQMAPKDISEAIRGATGVSVLSTTAYGRNSIRIRGNDAKHTLILINGKRVNSQDALVRGNDFDLGSVPLSAVERIEVVRGTMSSLYGSDALGGVVNVILKKPTEDISGEVSLLHEVLTEGAGGDLTKGNAYLSGELTNNVSGSIV